MQSITKNELLTFFDTHLDPCSSSTTRLSIHSQTKWKSSNSAAEAMEGDHVIKSIEELPSVCSLEPVQHKSPNS